MSLPFPEVTCQDENSIQYFEGATWSVGKCMQCSCKQGVINCSREVVLASFLVFTHKIQIASETTFKEHCNQTDCNVANFVRRNYGVCHGKFFFWHKAHGIKPHTDNKDI